MKPLPDRPTSNLASAFPDAVVHVFPRYHGDKLDAETELADHDEIRRLAATLRAAWPT